MKTLMKRLTFAEEDRASIVLSDPTKIRLDPTTHGIKLRAVGGKYSLSGNLYVLSAVTTPRAVRQWIGFQADIVHPKVNNAIVTSAYFRLHDGTDQWYWDGTAWSKSTNLWNTEAEVADHIAAYNATATCTLRVVVNLRTADPLYTPELKSVRLAYEADIDSQFDDLMYRSLVPALRDNLRPVSNFVATGNGTTSIALEPVLTAAGAKHRIVGVAAVYNHTTDPNHYTNLYQSYNSATKTVTCSGTIATNHTAWIKVVYAPIIIFEATAQDYIQVEEIPCILLLDANLSQSHLMGVADAVVNKDQLTAFRFPPNVRHRMHLSIHALAANGVDLQYLLSSIEQYFRENPIGRMTGTDEPFRQRLSLSPQSRTNPDLNEMRSAYGEITIEDVYFQAARAQDAADKVHPVGYMRFDIKSGAETALDTPGVATGTTSGSTVLTGILTQ